MSACLEVLVENYFSTDRSKLGHSLPLRRTVHPDYRRRRIACVRRDGAADVGAGRRKVQAHGNIQSLAESAFGQGFLRYGGLQSLKRNKLRIQ